MNHYFAAAGRVLGFNWLTGPVFDKEMRVSSRRKRTYALRTLYLIVLLLTMLLIWLEEIRIRGNYNVVYQVSRMSQVGLLITCVVVWIQYIAAQIIMGVSLSSAISDEINHRTLGTLMTTPITSVQIVFGKLVSKLLIVLQLVAIAFPMLGIVRVFGGVPWMCIFSSLYLTVTATILVGAISLFWSVFCRRAYIAIIATVLTMGVTFVLSVIFFILIVEAFDLERHLGQQVLYNFFSFTNPYATFLVNSVLYLEPGSSQGITIHWFINGLIMLAAAGVLMVIVSGFVRRAALAQIGGGVSSTPSKKKLPPGKPVENRKLRVVKGSPVLWKELGHPLFGKRKGRMLLLVIAGIGLLLLSYALLSLMDPRAIKDSDVQDCYTCILMGFGVLFTLVIPATAITTEKECGSWEILLSTPLTARRIVWGKYLGSLRRCLPAWGYLFVHLAIFVYLGMIRPLVLIQMPMVVIGMSVFLCATGVYFSRRFKSTTVAVIWNISSAAAIWILLPLIIAIPADIMNWTEIEHAIEWYMDTNPFVQAIVVTEGNTRGWTEYMWVGRRHPDPAGYQATSWIFKVMLGYILTAWLFVWRTGRRLRK